MDDEAHPIRANALARRTAAKRQAQAAREAAARFDAEAEDWAKFVAMYDQVAEVTSPPPQGATQSGAAGSAAGETVLATEAVAREIISEKLGVPVSTRDMLDAMQARGFEVIGKDPHATLHTRLTRAPTLEFMKPFGWRIKDASPEVGPEVPPARLETSESVSETHSSPVEPAAGGGI